MKISFFVKPVSGIEFRAFTKSWDCFRKFSRLNLQLLAIIKREYCSIWESLAKFSILPLFIVKAFPSSIISERFMNAFTSG